MIQEERQIEITSTGLIPSHFCTYLCRFYCRYLGVKGHMVVRIVVLCSHSPFDFIESNSL